MAGARGLDGLGPGDFIHICNHAVEESELFPDDVHREQFLAELQEAALPTVDVAAWSLVGNHFHLLVHLREDPRSLATFLRVAQGRYAVWFNRRHDRRGALLWRRYHRRPLPTEAAIRLVVGYIHANRLKDGFCTSADADPWSSHRAWLGLAPPLFADTAHRDLLFGTVEGYRHAFADMLPHWSDSEPRSLYEQLVLDELDDHAHFARYRRGLQVAALVEYANRSPSEIAERVGLSPSNATRAQRVARQWGHTLLTEVGARLTTRLPARASLLPCRPAQTRSRSTSAEPPPTPAPSA